MLLIWGWRSLLHVIGAGEFHCPRCGVDTPYRLVRPRRWFTFFFIPLIPLQHGETFVECTRCKGGFNEGILARPTNKQFGYMLALGARALYAQAFPLAYHHDEQLVERAVQALRPYTGVEYTAANLLVDVDAFAAADLASYLRPIGEHTVLQGRETMMSGFVRFAQQAGPLSPSTEAYVNAAAVALALSSTHLAGIVAAASVSDQLGEGA